jgi:serine phosphatase RsbU (regulator of sigma subunit)
MAMVSQTGLPARTPQPTQLVPVEDLDVAVRYHAARTGGDFFDAITTGSYLAFVLMDVAGRKPEADAIAAEVQDVFRQRASELLGSPYVNASEAVAELIHDVNGALMVAANGVRFAPAFLGLYNLSFSLLTYINSGGQAAVFRDADGTRSLEGEGMPLGLFTHMTHEPAMQAFEPGARLLIVTKGVLESRRGRKEFGVDGVSQLLKESTSDSASEICEATVEAAFEFRQDAWPRILGRSKSNDVEDLTAATLVRPRRK